MGLLCEDGSIREGSRCHPRWTLPRCWDPTRTLSLIFHGNAVLGNNLRLFGYFRVLERRSRGCFPPLLLLGFGSISSFLPPLPPGFPTFHPKKTTPNPWISPRTGAWVGNSHPTFFGEKDPNFPFWRGQGKDPWAGSGSVSASCSSKSHPKPDPARRSRGFRSILGGFPIHPGTLPMGIRSQNSLAQPGAGNFPQILNIALDYLGFF